MNVTLFVVLLGVFSMITSICTEGIKKLLDGLDIHYVSNVIVFIVSLIIGTGGTAVYYILNYIDFNLVNIVYLILMGAATAFGAMVGYDKVIQTIEQIKIKKFYNTY